MQENHIRPEKITKPIQLLAAWLIGLILLVGSLITAAATIKSPYWLPAFFAISSVCIIPIFLILIFLLQTKYRPEMQEDSFYSKYLDKNTMTFEYIDKKDTSIDETNNLRQEIISISERTKKELEEVKNLINSDGIKTNEEKAIETIIEKSDNRLDELKKIVKFANIVLRINVSLPKYSEIVEVVKKIGFTKLEEFGHGSAHPKSFLASIGKDIPLDLVRDLIFDLVPLGLLYVKETSPIVASIPRGNAIYIGSLSTQEKKIKVDEDLINKLNAITTGTKFEDIFRS